MKKEKFDSVKYRNEWKATQRERVDLILPIGTKAKIEKRISETGHKSTNAYINNLIETDLKKEQQ